MGNLVFTTLPTRGDIVLGELLTKKILFVKEDSFSDISDIDQTKYEVLGVVFKRDGAEVKFVHHTNSSKPFCKRHFFKLTGYTLDGTERTGVIYEGTTGTDYTITYQATTMAELVVQLNTYFSANAPFTTQDWMAEVVNDKYINIHLALTTWSVINDSGKSGFTLTNNTLPELLVTKNSYLQNGSLTQNGGVCSMMKALSYFRSDLNINLYNPITAVTTVRVSSPICLPAYLGTSQYRSEDMCISLRQVYGEGEKGWTNLMNSIRVVLNSDFLPQAENSAKTTELTKMMAIKRYTSQLETNEVTCPAAYYCYTISTQTLPANSFRMLNVRDLAELFEDIQYGVDGSRTSDRVNKSLYKLGGSAISTNNPCWTTGRSSQVSQWTNNATTGLFDLYFANDFHRSKVVIPAATYDLNLKKIV